MRKNIFLSKSWKRLGNFFGYIWCAQWINCMNFLRFLERLYNASWVAQRCLSPGLQRYQRKNWLVLHPPAPSSFSPLFPVPFSTLSSMYSSTPQLPPIPPLPQTRLLRQLLIPNQQPKVSLLFVLSVVPLHVFYGKGLSSFWPSSDGPLHCMLTMSHHHVDCSNPTHLCLICSTNRNSSQTNNRIKWFPKLTRCLQVSKGTQNWCWLLYSWDDSFLDFIL